MALSNYIQGNDTLLYLSEAADSANLKLWGCCRNVSLSGATETIEITPIDGKNTNFLPTYNGATIDADGIYIIPEYTDPQWASAQLWDWRINHTLLYWEIIFSKADGSTDTYSGTCYLTNTVLSGPVNDFSGITISAVVVNANTPSQDAQIACPVLTLDSTPVAVSYSFVDGGEGATVYYVNLLDNTDTLLQTVVVNAPFASPITGNFTGLDPATTYKVQLDLEQDSPYYQRSCASVSIATDAIPCPAIDFTVGENDIDYTFNDEGFGVDSYDVELYEGVTLLETDTFNAPFTNPLTGGFAGLDADTLYAVLLQVNLGAYNRACGPYALTTGGAVIAYPFYVGLGMTAGSSCLQSQDSPMLVYGDAAVFGEGVTLYSDSGLTTPMINYNYVTQEGSTETYPINSFTATIGAYGGLTC